MNLLLSAYDEFNNLIKEEYIDGHLFYEIIMVEISDKMKLTKMPVEYKKNTKEALMLRRNRKLSDLEKEKLLLHPKLKEEHKFILSLCSSIEKIFTTNKEVMDVVSNFSGLSFGATLNVNEFFEAIGNISLVNKLVFKKVE